MFSYIFIYRKIRGVSCVKKLEFGPRKLFYLSSSIIHLGADLTFLQYTTLIFHSFYSSGLMVKS